MDKKKLHRELKNKIICLYQWLEKEHLDVDNQLTDYQWKMFVKECQNSFASEVSEIGLSWFANNVNRIRVEYPNPETNLEILS